MNKFWEKHSLLNELQSQDKNGIISLLAVQWIDIPETNEEYCMALMRKL